MSESAGGYHYHHNSMPTNKLTIPTDDAQTIIDRSDPTGDYEIVNTGADPIIVNDRRADVLDKEGREIEPGRPAILTKDKSRETVHAIADGLVDGELTIEKTRFSIVKLPPMTLQGGRQNRGGFRAKTVTTDVETALPSVPIPDGFEALIQADAANGARVELRDGEGGSFPLSAGDAITLAVTNLSDVSVAPVSGTQTVHATVEV